LTSLVPLYIKKYYYNDPLFKESKVVYSTYNDDFKEPLDKTFSEKLLLEGITADDVAGLKDPNYLNVNKMAIDYSDAVIQGTESINPAVKDYINESGKLFLDYQPKESYIDAYNEFYEKV